MVSTFKLFLLTMVMNLVISGAIASYANPDTLNTAELNNQSQTNYDYYLSASNTSVTDNPVAPNVQEEGAYGNKFWLTKVFHTFFTGVKGAGLNPAAVNDPVEKLIAYIVDWFTGILRLMLLVEFFMLVFNKKTS